MPSDRDCLLNRRKFLTDSSMALAAIAGTSVAAAGRFAWAGPATTEIIEVEIAYGRLRGKRNGDLITFKGSPYAGPVSGENRFKAPPPLVPWTGIRDAFSPGPPSFQPSRPSFGGEEPFPSENCLVLNVWTPAVDHRRRPVMFYNHGGGFTTGSGSTWYQDGSNIARQYDVPAAKDYFNKVSIESGPGVHMTPRDLATETARMVLNELGLSDKEVRKLKEVPAQKLVEVQEALAQKRLGGLTLSGGRQGMVISRPGGFSPVVGGTYVPHHPFDPTPQAISRDKPLMVGTNRDEMTFFFLERKENGVFTLTEDELESRLDKEFGPNAKKVLATYRKSRPDVSPADLYIAITTARAMWLGSIEIAEKKYEQKSAPVYMYMFTHESNLVVPGTNHRLGAAHATEIWYKVNNVDLESPKDPSRPSLIGTDPDREKTALNMSEMWATFAKTGRPSAKGQSPWPAYTLPRRATMMIDAQCKVEDDPFGQEHVMWDSLTS